MRITLALSTLVTLFVALVTAGYFKLKARARRDSTRVVSRGTRW